MAAELGEDMVALFWAQWLVETEEIITEDAGLPDQEGVGGSASQEQCARPTSSCSLGLAGPAASNSGAMGDQMDESVVVEQEDRAEAGRLNTLHGSKSPAGFMGDV